MFNEAAWLDKIEKMYGVRLSEGQVYADNRGLVYAGSEYVARLGHTNGPEHATDWAASIAHFPRHLRTLEVATRTAA